MSESFDMTIASIAEAKRYGWEILGPVLPELGPNKKLVWVKKKPPALARQRPRGKTTTSIIPQKNRSEEVACDDDAVP